MTSHPHSQPDNASELLPCPFCGCADIRHERTVTDATVWCSSCGAKHRRNYLPIDDCLEVAKSNWNARAQCGVQTDGGPIAWIVRWSTVHTPKNASAYLNEVDARRAAANVKMYAHASDVTVIPTFAAPAFPSAEGNTQ